MSMNIPSVMVSRIIVTQYTSLSDHIQYWTCNFSAILGYLAFCHCFRLLTAVACVFHLRNLYCLRRAVQTEWVIMPVPCMYHLHAVSVRREVGIR